MIETRSSEDGYLHRCLPVGYYSNSRLEQLSDAVGSGLDFGQTVDVSLVGASYDPSVRDVYNYQQDGKISRHPREPQFVIASTGSTYGRFEYDNSVRAEKGLLRNRIRFGPASLGRVGVQQYYHSPVRVVGLDGYELPPGIRSTQRTLNTDSVVVSGESPDSAMPRRVKPAREAVGRPDTSRMTVTQLVDFAARELKESGTTTLEFTPDQIGQLMDQVVRNLLSTNKSPITDIGRISVAIDSGKISIKGSAVAQKGVTVDVSFNYNLNSNADGSLGSGNLELNGFARGMFSGLAKSGVDSELAKIQSEANNTFRNPSQVLTIETRKQLKPKRVELESADWRIDDDRLVVTLHSKQKPLPAVSRPTSQSADSLPPVRLVVKEAPKAEPVVMPIDRPPDVVVPRRPEPVVISVGGLPDVEAPRRAEGAEVILPAVEVTRDEAAEISEPSPRDTWEAARSALEDVLTEVIEGPNASRKVGKIIAAVGPLINSYRTQGFEPTEADRVALKNALRFTSDRIRVFEDSLLVDFEPERTEISWDDALPALQVALTQRSTSQGSLGDIIGALGPVLEAYPGLSKSEREVRKQALNNIIKLLKHDLGKLTEVV